MLSLDVESEVYHESKKCTPRGSRNHVYAIRFQRPNSDSSLIGIYESLDLACKMVAEFIQRSTRTETPWYRIRAKTPDESLEAMWISFAKPNTIVTLKVTKHILETNDECVA